MAPGELFFLRSGVPVNQAQLLATVLAPIGNLYCLGATMHLAATILGRITAEPRIIR